MTAINTMVIRTAGLIDTKDVSVWENSFLKNVQEITNNGEDTTPLSTFQVEQLEIIYQKHFE